MALIVEDYGFGEFRARERLLTKEEKQEFRVRRHTAKLLAGNMYGNKSVFCVTS